MKVDWFIRLALLAMMLALTSCAAERSDEAPARGYRLSTVFYQAGDDPRWSDLALDDSSWTQTQISSVDGIDGIYWMRAHIDLEGHELPVNRPLGVLFMGLATVDLFWDGHPLPTKGVVGATPEQETPGPISLVVHVPDSLATPGRHVIALRLSHHHRGFVPSNWMWALMFGDYGYLREGGTSYTWTSLMSLSGMLVAGIYFLVLFLLNRRERSHLLLGLVCAASATLLVAESYRELVGYTYDWHLTRLRIVTGLSYLVNLLLVGFLVTRYPLPGRRMVLWSAALLYVIPIFAFQSWDPKAAFMFLIGFVIAFGWSIHAVLRRQPGSVFVLGGILACLAILLISPFRFLDLTFFLSLDLLLIALLMAHAVQIRKTQREREVALLRSARLEAELLRRHIQPHFLMNTLTALSDWIEEDPRVASRMIHALAEEFRALSAVADRALVPLRDEVRLCRSHLEVMALRRGCDYRLTTEDLEGEVKIPPAVFHTLVENAITHNPKAKIVELRLAQKRVGGNIHFVFDAPVGEEAAVGSPDGKTADGTGLRYVRTRLSEAYGSSWRLSSGPAEGFYRTEIVVPSVT